MLEYNDESKGYIKLDGTRIQYPIVEHDDNDFYLVRGSDKISNGAVGVGRNKHVCGLTAGCRLLAVCRRLRHTEE